MNTLTSWLASPPPDAAIELAADAVSAAVLGTRGTEAVVEAFAYEPLPAGALTPSLSGQNIANRAAVAAAIQAAVSRVASRPRRVALVIPDVAARVSLLKFDQVPAARNDLDQLIRWHLKKSAPFSIEDACVTHAPGALASDGGREFIVALARREAVLEYESVCEDSGLYAGIVDLSSFSVVNCFLSGGPIPTGDWLVVHMRSDYTSIVILRGGAVIYFRSKPEGDGDPFADLVHQTTMYYQDRLSGQGFSRVLVGGPGRTGTDVEVARRGLEERLGMPVEPVDPTRLAVLPEGLNEAPTNMGRVVPLIGMLLRTRHEVQAA